MRLSDLPKYLPHFAMKVVDWFVAAPNAWSRPPAEMIHVSLQGNSYLRVAMASKKSQCFTNPSDS
jgi:hypothetical protein